MSSTNGLEDMDWYALPSDMEKDVQARGIDYDLHACLTYNPQDTFGVEHIDRVLAVYEGENDGEDWRWILRLMDGRYVYLRGGCDYTGWDCQSSAGHVIVESAAAALSEAEKDEDGYGKDTAIFVAAKLREQLATGKDETWREAADKVMRT